MSKYNYIGIRIHKENPSYVSDFSKTLLNGHYVREGETIPEALARAAVAFCYGDYALAQRIYDYAHNGRFMYSSPVLSNSQKGTWVEKNDELANYYWHNHEFI